MTWLRYDLHADLAHPRLYALLSETTGLLLQGWGVTEVFYVHTPDGLRVRCRAAQPITADVAWRAALTEAQESGLLTGWQPAPYEPEQFGLGGPDAMAGAHRMFTADSAAWLGFLARADRPVPTVARWAMSVLMIRALVAGLDLTPADLSELWHRIGRITGATRPAPGRLAVVDGDDPAVRRLALALRAGWDEPTVLYERLSPDQRRLLTAYEATARIVGPEWRAAADRASVRHGATLAVTFHWNRAAMPLRHRHLLLAALTSTAPTAALVAA